MLRISLSVQEVEFALACKDFVLEHDHAVGQEIIIENAELVVPQAPSSQQVFLDYGLARLLRVFHLAIENKAVPIETVPTLISDLARFNEKILRSFSAISDHNRLH
jgi:hypothetical protein